MTQTASSTDPKVLVQRLLAPIADDMKAVDDYIRAELASDVSRMHEISEYITSLRSLFSSAERWGIRATSAAISAQPLSSCIRLR